MPDHTAEEALRDLALELGYDIVALPDDDTDDEPERPRIRRVRRPKGCTLTRSLAGIALDTAERIERALAAPSGYSEYRERVYDRWMGFVHDLAVADEEYWFAATPLANRVHRLRHTFQAHWSREGYAARLRDELDDDDE